MLPVSASNRPIRTYKIHSFVSYYNNLIVPFIPSPEYILVNDLISFPVFYKRRECECDARDEKMVWRD